MKGESGAVDEGGLEENSVINMKMLNTFGDLSPQNPLQRLLKNQRLGDKIGSKNRSVVVEFE